MLSIDSLPLLPVRDGFLFAATCAILSHGTFKKFEPTSQSNFILTILLLGVFPSLPTLFLRPHFSNAWSATVATYCTFYTVLSLSIVLYRISPFHPLAKYPGPFLDKITKFRGMWITSTGKQHIYFKELHEKYGPYVRVGPNELSFLDVDTVSPIMGADGMPKGPNWEGRRSPDVQPALISTRNLKEHAKRRKVWNKAFNSHSVKDYKSTIVKRGLQLADELQKRAGETVDLAKWMSFFTFDFMGDMAFGGGFELMADNDKDGLWHLMERGVHVFALTAHIPWAAGVIMRWPVLTRDVTRLRNFAAQRVILRKKNGSSTKDLFYHLIDEDNVEPQPPSFTQIVSDAMLAIVAGSDTTATVMSNVFYYLLSNPSDLARLRAEVDNVFPPGEGDPFEAAKLAEMPFLNAVINESMRLQPPVASGSQRAPESGSGGKMVGNHFIPEGTAIFVPTYAIHRDPRYFSPNPDKFWPDRWLKGSNEPHKSDIITNHAAFVPFSFGPANCAGKNLALVEMRMVVALLLQRFDMRFEDGFDGRVWEDKLEDWFAMTKGSLPIVLTARI